jgi:hypothetical protein
MISLLIFINWHFAVCVVRGKVEAEEAADEIPFIPLCKFIILA